jgi:hypothetical protein
VGSPILQPCSLASPRLCYTNLPPLRPAGSLWDKPLSQGSTDIYHLHQATPPPGLHSPAGSLPYWAVLPNPARSLLCRPGSQGLHSPAGALSCWAACPSLQDLCSALLAMPPKPAQHCTIFSLQGSASKACQARDPHTHDLCCQARKPQVHSISTPPALQAAKPMLQRPCYFTSAKGLHPKAHGTTPTIHLPQEGSKPT